MASADTPSSNNQPDQLTALDRQIKEHETSDNDKSWLNQAVGKIVEQVWTGDKESLANLKGLSEYVHRASAAGDTTVPASLQPEIAKRIEADKKAVESQAEYTGYGVQGLKTAALFLSDGKAKFASTLAGKVGLAGTLGLYASDDIKSSDSGFTKVGEGLAGAGQGIMLKGIFHGAGKYIPDFAASTEAGTFAKVTTATGSNLAKGLVISAGSRASDLTFSASTYQDQGNLDVEDALGKIASGTFDSNAMKTDALLFGLTGGLMHGATRGALAGSPMAQSMMMSGFLGAGSTGLSEYNRQAELSKKTGTSIDWLEVGRKGSISLLVNGIAGAPGGIAHQPIESLQNGTPHQPIDGVPGATPRQPADNPFRTSMNSSFASMRGTVDSMRNYAQKLSATARDAAQNLTGRMPQFATPFGHSSTWLRADDLSPAKDSSTAGTPLPAGRTTSSEASPSPTKRGSVPSVPLAPRDTATSSTTVPGDSTGNSANSSTDTLSAAGPWGPRGTATADSAADTAALPPAADAAALPPAADAAALPPAADTAALPPAADTAALPPAADQGEQSQVPNEAPRTLTAAQQQQRQQIADIVAKSELLEQAELAAQAAAAVLARNAATIEVAGLTNTIGGPGGPDAVARTTAELASTSGDLFSSTNTKIGEAGTITDRATAPVSAETRMREQPTQSDFEQLNTLLSSMPADGNVRADHAQDLSNLLQGIANNPSWDAALGKIYSQNASKATREAIELFYKPHGDQLISDLPPGEAAAESFQEAISALTREGGWRSAPLKKATELNKYIQAAAEENIDIAPAIAQWARTVPTTAEQVAQWAKTLSATDEVMQYHPGLATDPSAQEQVARENLLSIQMVDYARRQAFEESGARGQAPVEYSPLIRNLISSGPSGRTLALDEAAVTQLARHRELSSQLQAGLIAGASDITTANSASPLARQLADQFKLPIEEVVDRVATANEAAAKAKDDVSTRMESGDAKAVLEFTKYLDKATDAQWQSWSTKIGSRSGTASVLLEQLSEASAGGERTVSDASIKQWLSSEKTPSEQAIVNRLLSLEKLVRCYGEAPSADGSPTVLQRLIDAGSTNKAAIDEIASNTEETFRGNTKPNEKYISWVKKSMTNGTSLADMVGEKGSLNFAFDDSATTERLFQHVTDPAARSALASKLGPANRKDGASMRDVAKSILDKIDNGEADASHLKVNYLQSAANINFRFKGPKQEIGQRLLSLSLEKPSALSVIEPLPTPRPEKQGNKPPKPLSPELTAINNAYDTVIGELAMRAKNIGQVEDVARSLKAKNTDQAKAAIEAIIGPTDPAMKTYTVFIEGMTKPGATAQLGLAGTLLAKRAASAAEPADSSSAPTSSPPESPLHAEPLRAEPLPPAGSTAGDSAPEVLKATSPTEASLARESADTDTPDSGRPLSRPVNKFVVNFKWGDDNAAELTLTRKDKTRAFSTEDGKNWIFHDNSGQKDKLGKQLEAFQGSLVYERNGAPVVEFDCNGTTIDLSKVANFADLEAAIHHLSKAQSEQAAATATTAAEAPTEVSAGVDTEEAVTGNASDAVAPQQLAGEDTPASDSAEQAASLSSQADIASETPPAAEATAEHQPPTEADDEASFSKYQATATAIIAEQYDAIKAELQRHADSGARVENLEAYASQLHYENGTSEWVPVVLGIDAQGRVVSGANMHSDTAGQVELRPIDHSAFAEEQPLEQDTVVSQAIAGDEVSATEAEQPALVTDVEAASEDSAANASPPTAELAAATVEPETPSLQAADAAPPPAPEAATNQPNPGAEQDALAAKQEAEFNEYQGLISQKVNLSDESYAPIFSSEIDAELYGQYIKDQAQSVIAKSDFTVKPYGNSANAGFILEVNDRGIAKTLQLDTFTGLVTGLAEMPSHTTAKADTALAESDKVTGTPAGAPTAAAPMPRIPEPWKGQLNVIASERSQSAAGRHRFTETDKGWMFAFDRVDGKDDEGGGAKVFDANDKSLVIEWPEGPRVMANAKTPGELNGEMPDGLKFRTNLELGSAEGVTEFADMPADGTIVKLDRKNYELTIQKPDGSSVIYKANGEHIKTDGKDSPANAAVPPESVAATADLSGANLASEGEPPEEHKTSLQQPQTIADVPLAKDSAAADSAAAAATPAPVDADLSYAKFDDPNKAAEYAKFLEVRLRKRGMDGDRADKFAKSLGTDIAAHYAQFGMKVDNIKIMDEPRPNEGPIGREPYLDIKFTLANGEQKTLQGFPVFKAETHEFSGISELAKAADPPLAIDVAAKDATRVPVDVDIYYAAFDTPERAAAYAESIEAHLQDKGMDYAMPESIEVDYEVLKTDSGYVPELRITRQTTTGGTKMTAGVPIATSGNDWFFDQLETAPTGDGETVRVLRDKWRPLDEDAFNEAFPDRAFYWNNWEEGDGTPIHSADILPLEDDLAEGATPTLGDNAEQQVAPTDLSRNAIPVPADSVEASPPPESPATDEPPAYMQLLSESDRLDDEKLADTSYVAFHSAEKAEEFANAIAGNVAAMYDASSVRVEIVEKNVGGQQRFIPVIEAVQDNGDSTPAVMVHGAEPGEIEVVDPRQGSLYQNSAAEAASSQVEERPAVEPAASIESAATIQPPGTQPQADIPQTANRPALDAAAEKPADKPSGPKLPPALTELLSRVGAKIPDQTIDNLFPAVFASKTAFYAAEKSDDFAPVRAALSGYKFSFENLAYKDGYVPVVTGIEVDTDNSGKTKVNAGNSGKAEEWFLTVNRSSNKLQITPVKLMPKLRSELGLVEEAPSAPASTAKPAPAAEQAQPLNAAEQRQKNIADKAELERLKTEARIAAELASGQIDWNRPDER